MIAAAHAACESPRCAEHALAGWYTPHAQQRRVHRSRARWRNLVAGRRGGKTLCAAVEFMRSVYRDLAAGRARATTTRDLPIFVREPRLIYWVIAPESSLYKVSERYVLKSLPDGVRRLLDAGVHGKFRGAPTPQLWLPGDILIEWRSGVRPEMLVSEGIDGAWLTEAARLKPEVWQDNVFPALADRRGWLLTDTTPLGQNWYHEELWRRGQVGDVLHLGTVENFTWRTVDNTSVPELRAEVEHARSVLRPEQFAREYEASFVAYKGQIYQLGARHVFAGPVDASLYREVIAGFDWGRASPAALVVIGVRPDDGYDVVEEHYEAGRLAAHWIKVVREVCKAWRVTACYSDPSSPLIGDMQNEEDIPMESTTERNVVVGIERVAALFDGGRLRVHARCANLLREAAAYRWAPTQTGTGDRPVKQDDHALDALRYALVSHERGDAYYPIE